MIKSVFISAVGAPEFSKIERVRESLNRVLSLGVLNVLVVAEEIAVRVEAAELQKEAIPFGPNEISRSAHTHLSIQ